MPPSHIYDGFHAAGHQFVELFEVCRSDSPPHPQTDFLDSFFTSWSFVALCCILDQTFSIGFMSGLFLGQSGSRVMCHFFVNAARCPKSVNCKSAIFVQVLSGHKIRKRQFAAKRLIGESSGCAQSIPSEILHRK